MKEHINLTHFLERQNDAKVIKFQAWDELKKRIVTSDELLANYITLTSNGSLLDLNGKIIEHLMPLLWTGMKDVLNKDIFQGHIIQTSARVGRGYQDRPLSIVYYSPITGAWNPYELYVAERRQIVGNIFEHPEILS